MSSGKFPKIVSHGTGYRLIYWISQWHTEANPDMNYSDHATRAEAEEELEEWRYEQRSEARERACEEAYEAEHEPDYDPYDAICESQFGLPGQVFARWEQRLFDSPQRYDEARINPTLGADRWLPLRQPDVRASLCRAPGESTGDERSVESWHTGKSVRHAL